MRRRYINVREFTCTYLLAYNTLCVRASVEAAVYGGAYVCLPLLRWRLPRNSEVLLENILMCVCVCVGMLVYEMCGWLLCLRDRG